MKRGICFSAVLCLCLLFCFSAVALPPSPTNDFFVNDYANVIESDDYSAMQAQGVKLYADCKAQVVAVTVNSLEGQDIESYSLSLARKWGIGDKQEDNGILLLLAVEDREVRIEVGYGLEGALPDSKTGRILDTYGMDYFRVDEFSEGLRQVYNSIVNEVYLEYGLEPSEDYQPVNQEDDTREIAVGFIGIIIFIGLMFLIRRNPTLAQMLLLSSVSRGRHGGHRGGGGGFRGGGGGFGGGGSSRRF